MSMGLDAMSLPRRTSTDVSRTLGTDRASCAAPLSSNRGGMA